MLIMSSLNSLGLGLELSKDSNSLADLLVKLSKVIQEGLDLLNGEINHHASDLGSSLLADELLDVLIDELSNELLVLGVLGNHSRKKGEALCIVAVDHWVGVSKGLQVTLDGNLSLLRNNIWNGGNVGVLINRTTADVWLLLGTTAIGERAVATLVHWAIRAMMHETTVVGLLRLVCGEAAANVALEKKKDLLDKLDSVRSRKNVSIKRESLKLALSHKISTVSRFCLLSLTNLGELIVGHKKSFAFAKLVMNRSTGVSSLVRLLEAHKSAGTSRFFRPVFKESLDDFDGLNLAIDLKYLAKLLLAVVLGETFNEEVALLLGVLEALLFAVDLSETLFLRDGWLNIQLEAVDFFLVKISNYVLSALRSVRPVTSPLVADESEGFFVALSVLLYHGTERLDLTVLREDLLELGLVPIRVVVLHIDIVVSLGHITLILWLIW